MISTNSICAISFPLKVINIRPVYTLCDAAFRFVPLGL